MPHEISPIYFIEYFFFCSTHGFDIELYDILYSILCKLYILWIGVLDWHIHCARVWYEIIKIVEHRHDFHLGSCKHFVEVEKTSGISFDWYRILFWNFEICTISLFSFGLWYTLMENKHQISLYIGLIKMANILQITFSNGFSFKKLLSVFLSISLSLCLSVFLSVYLSVCLSLCLCLSQLLSLCFLHGIIMKFSGVITIDRSDVYANIQGQKSKVKVTGVKTQIGCFGTITPVWFLIWWWNDSTKLDIA